MRFRIRLVRRTAERLYRAVCAAVGFGLFTSDIESAVREEAGLLVYNAGFRALLSTRLASSKQHLAYLIRLNSVTSR